MEYSKIANYAESLKKLNDFMASMIAQLNHEAALLENSLLQSRKSFHKAAGKQ